MAVCGLLLSACAGLQPQNDILGFSGLGNEIRNFYEQHAVEQNWSCTFPRIDTILTAQRVEEGAEEQTIRVRYAWRSGGGRIDPGANLCRGTAERDFVIRPLGDRAVVVAMTGGQRRR
ncbi:MAG: hypothetical protein EA356_12330 [Geminicoccaceae bacterium]|nr:MAG: hypothetical protein EA356_12330 [Geminicoccaceae bacterium]